MTDKQQPDPLAWVNGEQDDDAIKWLSEKSRAAAVSSKNSYHLTQHRFDGVNHWSDFVELECVLSHIKWQRELIWALQEELSRVEAEANRLRQKVSALDLLVAAKADTLIPRKD